MSEGRRIAIFIDGANVYSTAKVLGFDIDYKKLLKAFSGTIVRAYYYTAMLEDVEYNNLRPLVDWLDYNGYTVVTKAAKEYTNAQGLKKIKGNMDIEMTVNMLELAYHGRIDEMFVFSGDGDFRAVVEAVQKQGVRVNVVSTIQTNPSMIADELRRQADVFYDLELIKPKIARGHDEPEQDVNTRIVRRAQTN